MLNSLRGVFAIVIFGVLGSLSNAADNNKHETLVVYETKDGKDMIEIRKLCGSPKLTSEFRSYPKFSLSYSLNTIANANLIVRRGARLFKESESYYTDNLLIFALTSDKSARTGCYFEIGTRKNKVFSLAGIDGADRSRLLKDKTLLQYLQQRESECLLLSDSQRDKRFGDKVFARSADGKLVLNTFGFIGCKKAVRQDILVGKLSTRSQAWAVIVSPEKIILKELDL